MNCARLLAALRDARLTRTDLAILGILLQERDAPLSRKEIASEAGCAASSVPRSARKLESLGYVERIVDARDHGGRAKPTGYRLKADTYQDGHVPTPVRTQTDTLEVVAPSPKRSQKAPARIQTDTSQSPPMIYNSTPQEIYPERPESSGEVAARAKENLVDRICGKVNSPWLDPNKSAGLITTSPLLDRWAQSLDIDSELVPLLKAKIACNGYAAISSWKYFRGAVEDMIALKTQPETARNDRQPTRAADALYPRRKRNAVSDLLMRDILDGDPGELRGLEPYPCK